MVVLFYYSEHILIVNTDFCTDFNKFTSKFYSMGCFDPFYDTALLSKLNEADKISTKIIFNVLDFFFKAALCFVTKG